MPHRDCSHNDAWPEVADRVWKQITYFLPRCPINHCDALYDEVQSAFRQAALRAQIMSPRRFADTITRRRLIDHVRYEAPLISIAEEVPAECSPCHPMETVDAHLDLRGGLAELAGQDPAAAFAFIEVVLNDKRLKDVAGTMHVSIATVHRLVKRARHFLKAWLADA